MKILLIEDDPDDIELLEEAMKENNIEYSMDVIMEGDKVADYIEKAVDFPAVIVLDFNLPRVHGKEVLSMIKSSTYFNKIPLIVLTTSAAKEDIEYSLAMGALHFITKPTSIHGFENTVITIVEAANSKGS